MNKVLIAIPTAPYLDYKGYEKTFATSEWGLANMRFDRIWGRFNGPASERQTAVRETWAKHVAPATFKFFVGRTWEGPLPDDMIKLDCDDDYLEGLQRKIQLIGQYALDNGYDIVFKCDDDTFVYPDLVPYLCTTTVDYGGYVWSGMSAAGGPGYVWSRRAMQAAVDTPLTAFNSNYEDWHYSLVMQAAGIKVQHITGIEEEPNVTHPVMLSYHPVSPKGMREAYQKHYVQH